jgi:hypothetical protein
MRWQRRIGLTRWILAATSLAAFALALRAMIAESALESAQIARVAASTMIGPVALAGFGARLVYADCRLARSWLVGMGSASVMVAIISSISAAFPDEHWIRMRTAGFYLEAAVVLGTTILAGLGAWRLGATGLNAAPYAALTGIASYDLFCAMAAERADEPAGPASVSLACTGVVIFLAAGHALLDAAARSASRR